MVNSRKIEDLDPRVQAVCKRHIELCSERGVKIIVTSTWRDYESQDALYAIGRTTELDRKPVTKARAGRSWHNFRCAYDVVGVVDGKAVWNASDPIWKIIVQAGKDAGAEAGAEWVSFPDLPHFQVKPVDMTLTQAKAHFDVSGSIFA